jgi:uncharacterized membrane protein
MKAMMILFLWFGVLYIVMGIPLLCHFIPPNPIYGFRTKHTRSSLEIWYKINGFMGKQLTLWGTLFGIIGLVLFFLYSFLNLSILEKYEHIGIIFSFGILSTPIIVSIIYYFLRCK